jgi:hypothetical protein
VFAAILKLVARCPRGWVGNPTDLLAELRELADDGVVRLRSFPASAATLTRNLKRLAPTLKAQGIEYTARKVHGGRLAYLGAMKAGEGAFASLEAPLPAPESIEHLTPMPQPGESIF